VKRSFGLAISTIALAVFPLLIACAESPTQWYYGYDGADSSTVGLWKFEEGSGTTVSNEMAYGSDGTLVNADWTSGRIGNYALGLSDTSGDYVEILSYAELAAVDSSYTIEFWVKPDFLTYIRPNTGYMLHSNNRILFKVYKYDANDFNLQFTTWDGGIKYYDYPEADKYELPGKILPGEWTHVAGVWDEATKTKLFYINGLLVYEESYTSMDGANNKIWLGCTTDNPTNSNFCGLIDELRISNVAREFAIAPETPWGPKGYPEKQLEISKEDTSIALTWNSFSEASYDIEWTNSIDSDWIGMGLGLAGTGDSMSYIDTTVVDKRFYRVAASSDSNCVIVTPSDDLGAIIEGASDNTTIILTSGTFNLYRRSPYPYMYGTIIQNITNLTITGQGWDNTRIKLDQDVFIGFYMGSNVENLIIEKLRIQGTFPFQNAPYFGPHAIGNSSGSTNIHNVAFRELWVEDVAVGISVGTSPTGVYEGVTITDNVVINIPGTEAGSGYGIHNSNAKNVLIANNFIEKCGRHGIYQARSAVGWNIVIENNLILHEDYYYAQPRWYAGALKVSRSSDVKVANNIVLNSHTAGITVRPDGLYGWPTDDIFLINNQIIGCDRVGLLVTTNDTHIVLGNTFLQYPGNAYPEISFNDYANGVPTSSGLETPDLRWENLDYVAELDGYIYAMKNGILDKITPYTWSYSTCGTTWTNTEGMTALEDAVGAGQGRLYIVADGTLYEVDPDGWGSNYNVTDWSGTQLMTAASGYVHIMKDNVLYKVTPSTLDYADTSAGWSNPRWMGDWGGNIYLFDDFTYYQIGPITMQNNVIGY
jgi:concanavalin A-like lectin/glucanase superfamily protein/parallel beta helix pectate lyase-like protein